MAHAGLDAARYVELVGVDLGAHAVLGAAAHDALCLFDREEALVAEYVDEVGQILCGDGRDHLAAYHIDILRLAAYVVARHGMRSEKCRAHGYGRCLADAAYDAQHLQLVFGRESVAALDLDKTRTHGDDLVDALHGLTVELILGCGVQAVGRIEYAAAAPGDLLVAQTVDLVEELLLAAAGIDDMRMRVAERRKEHAAAGIDRFVGIDLRQPAHLTVVGDDALVGDEPRVVERAHGGHVGSRDALATALVDADDRAYVFNQQSHTRRGTSPMRLYGDT